MANKRKGEEGEEEEEGSENEDDAEDVWETMEVVEESSMLHESHVRADPFAGAVSYAASRPLAGQWRGGKRCGCTLHSLPPFPSIACTGQVLA